MDTRRWQGIKSWVGKHPRRSVGVAVCLLAVVFFTARSWRGVPADYLVIKEGDAQETLLANGLIVGEGVVDLTMPVTGQVMELPVASGSQVAAGDPLLRLDGSRQELTLRQQEAAYQAAVASRRLVEESEIAAAAARLQQAQAEADYLQEYLSRQEQLFAAGGLAEMQLLAARRDAQVAAAKAMAAASDYQGVKNGRLQLAYAQEAQAKAVFETGQRQLADMTLTAPFDGRLLRLMVNRGETVTAGTPVAKILPGGGGLEIEVKVDEGEVGKIKVGQEAYFTVAARPGEVFAARVDAVGALVNRQSGTSTVILHYVDSQDDLLADMTVSAQIVIAEYADVLTIPAAWTRREAGEVYALLYRRGRGRLVSLEGRYLGDGYFMVEKGLQAGDKILSPQVVTPGARVRLAKQVDDV